MHSAAKCVKIVLEHTFKGTSSRYMIKKPIKGEYLEILLRSPKTIFTTKDAALLWGEAREQIVSGRLNKYVKVGKLIRVRRGIYAKDANYDRLELATRICTPAYISFETVLIRAGINFQYYETIFVASYVTRELKIAGQNIAFTRMKDYVLSNPAGIDHTAGYAIATPERAMLDRIYVSKDYHFDLLDMIDWDKVFALVPIYHNQRLAKKVQEYFAYYKSQL